jgi:8-oxo-dGTP diphosphatase
MLVAADPAEKPTHAGGLVYRIRRGRLEFLLVTAKRATHLWVYPKGHVEKRETPRETAIREVAEEAGTDAVVKRKLRDLVYEAGGYEIRVRYFLMRARNAGSPCEGRRLAWVSSRVAHRRIRYADSRTLLRLAVEILRAE